MNLNDLQVLSLDCQATGAYPARGTLLEIGWVQTRAAEIPGPRDLAVKSYPVRLPPDFEIPGAVQRITGISKQTLAKTTVFSPGEIWQKIVKIAGRIAAANQMERCPAVIHYARFEAPFLRNLHAESKSSQAFPLQLICTHEIARRMLPGLPRKGLRAVAGYYGHSVSPARRSADHAMATAVIWRHLIQQLKADHDIQNLSQLTAWLDRTTARKQTARVYPMQRAVRLRLPGKPGVYRMRRSNGDLLYIGKATSLKQRVNSYFRQKGCGAEHTLEMLSQAADLDVTLTGSALEAALLESDEIKRHCPPYNVALRAAQRKLVFCSADLRSCAAIPDKIHPVGPLPEGKVTAAMTAFAVWHDAVFQAPEDTLLKIGYGILGVPQTVAPEPACLAEGMTLFCRNQRMRLAHSSALRIIKGLGRELWQERLEALQCAESETGAVCDDTTPCDRAPETEASPGWTPGKVARSIEKFAMRAALLIRRARWLCLLSESSLAWEARDSAGCRKNILRFENGIVAHRQELPGAAKVPPPAGYVKRIACRQKIFDLPTYERLRVATTELRRLVAEGRKVELRLKPNAILNRKHLARMLPWV